MFWTQLHHKLENGCCLGCTPVEDTQWAIGYNSGLWDIAYHQFGASQQGALKSANYLAEVARAGPHAVYQTTTPKAAHLKPNNQVISAWNEFTVSTFENRGIPVHTRQHHPLPLQTAQLPYCPHIGVLETAQK